MTYGKKLAQIECEGEEETVIIEDDCVVASVQCPLISLRTTSTWIETSPRIWRSQSLQAQLIGALWDHQQGAKNLVRSMEEKVQRPKMMMKS